MSNGKNNSFTNVAGKIYFNLDPEHANYDKKVYSRLPHDSVVRIIGPVLNCKERREQDENKEEDFYLQILLLHFPHQGTPLKLEDKFQSWKEMYEDPDIQKQLGVECKTFIEYHEDRWSTKLRGQERASRYKESLKALDSTVVEHDNKDGGDGCLMYEHEVHDECDSVDDEDGEDNILLEEYDTKGLPDEDFENCEIQPDDGFHMYPKDQICLPQFTKPLQLPRYTMFELFQSGMSVSTRPDLDNDFQSSMATGNHAGHMIVTVLVSFTKLVRDAITPGTATTTMDTTAATYNDSRLQFLQSQHPKIAASENKTIKIVVSPDAPLVDLNYFATLQEVSTIFKFKQSGDDQERAFLLIGEALLSEFAKDEELYTSINEDTEETFAKTVEQFHLLLHGLGGSGKSYVIRAVTALAQSWLRPNSIVIICQSGIGAVNVNGTTVASFLHTQKHYLDPVRFISINFK
jgi:hypothetical protein